MSLLPPIISAVQVGKLLCDGFKVFLAYVVDTPKEELKLEEIPIVRKYSEVFLEELSKDYHPSRKWSLSLS